MKPRTTLKFTSASRRATRTSLRASWMFSSVRRPWPPRRSKIAVSRVLSESNMERRSVRNYPEHFNASAVAGPLGPVFLGAGASERDAQRMTRHQQQEEPARQHD